MQPDEAVRGFPKHSGNAVCSQQIACLGVQDPMLPLAAVGGQCPSASLLQALDDGLQTGRDMMRASL